MWAFVTDQTTLYRIVRSRLVLYKPTSYHLNQIVKHEASREKDEEALSKDSWKDLAVPFKIKHHRRAFLEIVTDLESSLTVLHTSSDYWQVEIGARDYNKSAIKSYNGLYKFVQMPFWLKNAHAAFPRSKDVIIASLRW